MTEQEARVRAVKLLNRTDVEFDQTDLAVVGKVLALLDADMKTHDAASGWLPLDAMQRLRTFDEWREEDGDVLWWRFPICEAPYVGSPLDRGFAVETHGTRGLIARGNVGGWPFGGMEASLRWTAIPVPEVYLKGGFPEPPLPDIQLANGGACS